MKPTTRRIVCATDFSDNACRAGDVAVAIALRLQATLVLVHVTDEAHALAERTRDFRLAMRRAKTRLRQEAGRLRRGSLVVEEVLLHGQWAEIAIGEWIARNPPSLVVVSSVSKTAFDRWTLGSVSEHIAQHAPTPTLVVRAPERLLAWAQQEQQLNVVVAADFTVSSDAALAFVKDLRKVGGCAVTVAHINKPPVQQRWSARSDLAPISNPLRVRRQLLRALRQKTGETVDGAVEIRVETHQRGIDAALVRLAVETEADLIVVGAHQRHGLKRVAHASTSRGVLRHAPISVVCVPVPVALAHGVGHHPRLERVLVASDLSPSGDQAVPWAYAAVAAGGSVKLVHVLDPWKVPSPRGARTDPKAASKQSHRQRAAEARDKLAALVPAAAAVAGVRTELEVIEDHDPARAIGLVARRFGSDIICLATAEGSAVADTLFRSVGREGIGQSSPAVLLVRPEEP